MRILHQKYVLLGIVLIALFVRFYQLGTNPPSLSWDEVAWGYNGYAFSYDLRDEFGKYLPYEYIESFGDYKPPFYAYLTIVPINVWGLTALAARFPSAFFGVLTVVMMYLLAKRIFPGTQGDYIGMVSAAFLAISPWHINLSRAAFEANVAVFFIMLGVWAFLYAITEKSKRQTLWLSLAAVSFALSLYIFNTTRIVAPLLAIVLAIAFYKRLFVLKKAVVIAGIVGCMLALPLVPFLLSPQASLRFKEVNIFSDPKIVEMSNQEIQNDNNAWWSKIIHNRRAKYTFAYMKHYLDHFNPSFLFIRGDRNPRFSTQDVGQLFLWDLPFFLIGIFMLFKRKEGHWWLIPTWLLIGIIPAATARETPHALRIENSLPMFYMLIAYGFYQCMQYMQGYIVSQTRQRLVIGTVIVLLLGNFAYYYHGYLSHYPREYSGEWQYGYKEVVSYVTSVKGTYEQVYITSEVGRPYIYFLYYEPIDPETFRKNATVTRDVFGFVTVDRVGKYYFSKIPAKMETNGKKTLYIDVPKQVPEGSRVVKTFPLLNGSPAFVAYELDDI